MTRKKAALISFSRCCTGQDANSGRFRRCCACQNMNAHHAVSEQAQTTMVSSVRRRMPGAKRSAIPGSAPRALSLAWCQVSGSGTLRRIQKTSSAGRMPTRKTQRGW